MTTRGWWLGTLALIGGGLLAIAAQSGDEGRDKERPTDPTAASAAEGEKVESGKTQDNDKKLEKVVKTDAEWRKQLTPEQYRVTRLKGTERAFTGAYWNCDKDGVYRCVCCGAELFTSKEKFASSCGWPSFFASAGEQKLETAVDRSHFMVRTEVICSKCGAHLGHVFDDGPNPTGLRYCINSAALKLDEKRDETALPKPVKSPEKPR